MARYLGANQIAECQRCGVKGLARDLVRDGRNPQLLVFADCYDPPHEAERPFVPSDTEGMPRYPLAPENRSAPVASTLGAVLGATVTLTWAQFSAPASQIVTYAVHRGIGAGAPALLATLTPVANLNTGAVVYGSPYDTPAPGVGVTYTYFVRGTTVHGAAVNSNTVSVVGV